jgi:hypothetical protein
MCAVSVITDYGMRTNVINSSTQKLIDFYDLIKQAKLFDNLHGEPECESPDKVKWLKELEQLIKEDLV